jgi:hypothetical protein
MRCKGLLCQKYESLHTLFVCSSIYTSNSNKYPIEIYVDVSPSTGTNIPEYEMHQMAIGSLCAVYLINI